MKTAVGPPWTLEASWVLSQAPLPSVCPSALCQRRRGPESARSRRAPATWWSHGTTAGLWGTKAVASAGRSWFPEHKVAKSRASPPGLSPESPPPLPPFFSIFPHSQTPGFFAPPHSAAAAHFRTPLLPGFIGSCYIHSFRFRFRFRPRSSQLHSPRCWVVPRRTEHLPPPRELPAQPCTVQLSCHQGCRRRLSVLTSHVVLGHVFSFPLLCFLYSS